MGNDMPRHARRNSAVSCAKISEPIELPFGLWTHMGPRNRRGCTVAQPGEYFWTVRMRRRCGLFVKELWQLDAFIVVHLPTTVEFLHCHDL